MHIIVQPEEFHLHSDGKGWYRATMSRAARWRASRVRLSRRARSIATIDGAAIAAIDGVDM